MMKRKSCAGNIFFAVSLLIVFGIITIFYLMAGAYWFTYAILIGCIALLIVARVKLNLRFIISFVSFILIVAITMTGLHFLRVENNVSLSGTLTREGIRYVLRLPQFQGEGLFEEGANFSSNASMWKAPKGYTYEKIDLDGLPVEVLRANEGRSDKVILQFHGGAYVMGMSDIYRGLALRYSRLSGGATVISIDYRLAPENVFPAALEDAEKTWEWLLAEGYSEDNIIIVGDSAGGNLALALTAKLRDEDKSLPNALVLMSPWTDMAAEGESYTTNRYKDPMFGVKKGEEPSTEEKGNLYAGDTDLYHPYLSPVYGSFENFPAMLIQVGTYEILESDSVDVYEKAKAAGVDVNLTKYEGMFHVFQLAGRLIPESRAAWNEVEDFIYQRFN